VDDAPSTEDLDLASVTTRGELAALLRTVRLKADMPSLRALETRTKHQETPLSKTAVSEMLNGLRTPRKAVMVGFLRACGVRDDHLEPWVRAWERVAVGAAHAGRVPDGPPPGAEDPRTERLRDQSDRLRAENKRLRLQLAAMDRRRAEHESHPADRTNPRAAHSPIAAQRELGVLLRALREQQGLKPEEVAEHLMCSVNKVKGMEASFRAGTLRDVRDLCDLYGLTGEAERDRMMKLAVESKQRAWWQAYGLGYETYVGLEEEAERISAFQSSVIHGLLQTAGYARAGHEGAMPKLAPDQIEMQIEAKLTRQRILARDGPPHFAAVLDEAALHREFGGPGVMAAQLAKILDMSAQPHVTVQVLPFKLGAHPALESNFTILDLPGQAPDMVFAEGLIGSTYFEAAEELKRYRDIFRHLQSIALSPEDTADLIMALGRSYGLDSARGP
jgi:transcriptional regulator with XRE-family HTH domain